MPTPQLEASLLQSEPIPELKRLSAQYCIEEGGSHGPDHSERVFQMALSIGCKLDASLRIIAPSALLHDIGRNQESKTKGAVCHARKGAELAAPILKTLSYSRQEIKAICHCIRAHRFRGTSRPLTLEAKILFDADKLDSIGAIGIGRAFLFAGQIGARLHNGDIDLSKTSPYSTEDTAYREFQVKMSRVREQMLTPVGLHLAQQRHAFMELFFNQLNNEIYEFPVG